MTNIFKTMILSNKMHCNDWGNFFILYYLVLLLNDQSKMDYIIGSNKARPYSLIMMREPASRCICKRFLSKSLQPPRAKI